MRFRCHNCGRFDYDSVRSLSGLVPDVLSPRSPTHAHSGAVLSTGDTPRSAEPSPPSRKGRAVNPRQGDVKCVTTRPHASPPPSQPINLGVGRSRITRTGPQTRNTPRAPTSVATLASPWRSTRFRLTAWACCSLPSVTGLGDRNAPLLRE